MKGGPRFVAASDGTKPVPPTAVATDEAFAPGYYTGMLADGTGTYTLLLDDAMTGYLCVTGEDVAFDAECEAVPAEGSLLLQLEDGRSVLIAPDGTAELQ